TVQNMTTFGTNRANYVLSQIPMNLTVATSLSQSNGYYFTASPSVTLNGQGNVIDTRSISVNGNTATWSAWEGRWTNTVALQPGASVFFGSGVTLTVSGSGQLFAQGTAAQHILLARIPGGANWGSLDFLSATNESRLAYVDFEFCGGTTTADGHNAQVHVNT